MDDACLSSWVGQNVLAVSADFMDLVLPAMYSLQPSRVLSLVPVDPSFTLLLKSPHVFHLFTFPKGSLRLSSFQLRGRRLVNTHYASQLPLRLILIANPESLASEHIDWAQALRDVANCTGVAPLPTVVSWSQISAPSAGVALPCGGPKGSLRWPCAVGTTLALVGPGLPRNPGGDREGAVQGGHWALVRRLPCVPTRTGSTVVLGRLVLPPLSPLSCRTGHPGLRRRTCDGSTSTPLSQWMVAPWVRQVGAGHVSGPLASIRLIACSGC